MSCFFSSCLLQCLPAFFTDIFTITHNKVEYCHLHRLPLDLNQVYRNDGLFSKIKQLFHVVKHIEKLLLKHFREGRIKRKINQVVHVLDIEQDALESGTRRAFVLTRVLSQIDTSLIEENDFGRRDALLETFTTGTTGTTGTKQVFVNPQALERQREDYVSESHDDKCDTQISVGTQCFVHAPLFNSQRFIGRIQYFGHIRHLDAAKRLLEILKLDFVRSFVLFGGALLVRLVVI